MMWRRKKKIQAHTAGLTLDDLYNAIVEDIAKKQPTEADIDLHVTSWSYFNLLLRALRSCCDA
jgi:hypothetical protein